MLGNKDKGRKHQQGPTEGREQSHCASLAVLPKKTSGKKQEHSAQLEKFLPNGWDGDLIRTCVGRKERVHPEHVQSPHVF